MSHKPLSDRIRKAALGPTPKGPLRADWIGLDDVMRVADRLEPQWGLGWWIYGTTTERRMFLLLVAEALEETP